MPFFVTRSIGALFLSIQIAYLSFDQNFQILFPIEIVFYINIKNFLFLFSNLDFYKFYLLIFLSNSNPIMAKEKKNQSPYLTIKKKQQPKRKTKIKKKLN